MNRNAVRRRIPELEDMHQIGPYSKLLSRGSLDGRSSSGRFLKAFEASLVAHVGGSPSAVQIMLIRSLAVLALRCSLMEKRLGEDGTYGERDGRQYLAWSNALSRGLREIGYNAATPPAPTLAEEIAAAAARRRREASEQAAA